MGSPDFPPLISCHVSVVASTVILSTIFMQMNIEYAYIVQSGAASAITGVNYHIWSADVLAKLGWKTLDPRRKQLKLLLMYKIQN